MVNHNYVYTALSSCPLIVTKGKCPIAVQELISKSHLFFTLAEEIHDREIR